MSLQNEPRWKMLSKTSRSSFFLLLCCVFVASVVLLAAARTLAVSVVDHLDLQSRQTGVPVELAVVPVGLAIAAAH